MLYPLCRGIVCLSLSCLHLISSAQSDCPTATTFDFATHWGKLSLNLSLTHYFNTLDSRDGWAAILFSSADEKDQDFSYKGIDPQAAAAQQLIEYFRSGNYKKTTEKHRVVAHQQTPIPIQWVVQDAAKVQAHLTASDFGRFFFTRPNASEMINYCSEELVIKSWECWGSFHGLPKTVLFKGATILVLKNQEVVEHWEWLNLEEVVRVLN